jgi:hypothetical protein
MNNPKEPYREVEQGVKKTLREVDGHDVSDDLGNAGDEIRKDLGNAGDDLHRETERAIDDTGRRLDREHDEEAIEPRPTTTR